MKITEGVYKINIQNELGEDLEHRITRLDEKTLNIHKFEHEETHLQYNYERIKLHENDNLSMLKVDYVPKGKIITISVSFMW